MSKNVLCIAPQCPLPCVDGGKMGIFYPIKYLAKYTNLFFTTPVEAINQNIIQEFKSYNITYFPYKMNTKDDYRKYPLSLLKKWSFKFDKYYSADYLKYIEKIVNENNIEILWINAPHMAVYALKLKKKSPHLKIFLREHNIEYELVKQYANSCQNILLKAFSYFEYLKTKKYEISLWNKFDKVFFISDTDLEEANKHGNFSIKDVIYDGFENNSKSKNIQVEDNSFIFTGSLNGFQNINNLKHFVETIWKAFIKKQPECKLYLTGNTDDKLEKCFGYSIDYLKSLNIKNLGFVDNVQETILSKKIVVSPTLYGSGIRLKVLEAMGLGKVVFVLDTDYKMCRYFKDMENIVHYHEESTFSDKYNKIEKDISIYEQIAKNASNLATEIFDWNKYAEYLVKEFEK